MLKREVFPLMSISKLRLVFSRKPRVFIDQDWVTATGEDRWYSTYYQFVIALLLELFASPLR